MKKILALIAVLLLSGCATIIHGGGSQEVGFASTPAGATIEVEGTGRQYSTPCKLDLKRNKSYLITAEKSGYEPASATISKSVSGWLVGNILFGGLIGLVVDFASGGAYNLTPENVNFALTETKQQQAASPLLVPANVTTPQLTP